MAERVIAVKMTIDGKQSIKELDNIADALGEIEDGLSNVQKGSKGVKTAESAFEALNGVMEDNLLTIGQMGQAAEAYRNIAIQAGKESPIGQEALKRSAQLERQISDVTMEVDHLAQRGTNLQSALTLGSTVIAGYTAFEGIQATLGLENEELEETFVKLQGAMATMQAIQEINLALSKESVLVTKARVLWTKAMTVGQKALNVVMGTGTKSMKAFRLALASTGIGLIVILIGALIANFEAISNWITDLVKKFGGLKNVLLSLLGPIGWIIMAYQNMFGEVDNGMQAQIARQKELNTESEKAHKKRIAELQAQADKQKDLIQAIEERRSVQTEVHDLALLQAEAMGASETELFNIQKEQNEAKLALAKQEWEAKQELMRINREMAQAEYDRLKTFLETQAIMSGWTEEMIAKDLKRLEEAKQQYLEDEEAEIASNERAIAKMEAQNQIFINKRNKQLSDQAQKEIDAKDAENQKKLELEAKYQKDLEDMRVNSIQDQDKKEIELLKLKFKRQRESLIEQYGEGTELEKLLMEQRERELTDLEEKHRQARIEFEKQTVLAIAEAQKAQQELEDAKFQERLDTIQGHLDKAQMALDTLGAINELAEQINAERIEKVNEERDADLANLEENKQRQLAVEELNANQRSAIEAQFAMREWQIKMKSALEADKLARKQFKRNKAMQLSQAGLNTASAILQAIAQFGPPPSPMGIAGIASAGAIGAAQIAKIAMTKFEGTASSIAPPSFNIPTTSGSTSNGSSQNGDSNLQNDTGTNVQDLLQPKLQVSVVEIEEKMATVNEIDTISTL